jgi:hypothetical protein
VISRNTHNGCLPFEWPIGVKMQELPPLTSITQLFVNANAIETETRLIQPNPPPHVFLLELIFHQNLDDLVRIEDDHELLQGVENESTRRVSQSLQA